MGSSKHTIYGYGPESNRRAGRRSDSPVTPLRKEVETFAAGCDELIALGSEEALSIGEHAVVAHYISEVHELFVELKALNNVLRQEKTSARFLRKS